MDDNLSDGGYNHVARSVCLGEPMTTVTNFNAIFRSQPQIASVTGGSPSVGSSPTDKSTATSPAPSSTVTISQQAYSLLSSTTDTRAPKVTRFTPTDNARNVSLTANIVVTFSETIRAGTGNIVLRDATGTTIETFDVATSSRVSISSKTLKIDPTNSLEYGTHYFVAFEGGTVTDVAGNNFAGTDRYDFATKQEKIPPKVISFFPADGVVDVSPSQSIRVTFSENIKRGSGNIVLKDSSGKIIETYKAASSSNISISNNTLTIDPSNKLATNKRYFVTFAPGSIKDLVGNNYAGAKGYDFTTATIDIPAVSPPGTIENADDPGRFNITLDYSGDSTYATYFDQARTIWENIITGDLQAIGSVDDLKISATVEAIDGANGVLGSASPTYLRSGSYIPYEGTMRFDVADLSNMAANGTLLKVIAHEMGHVLGIGSLWGTFGFNTTLGQYTGAQALAAYKAMSGGDPTATYVPLETGGSAGTQNVHWSESKFDTELMTGFAESSSNMPLSILTIAALEDLGYQVNGSVAEAYTVPA